ncbi:MAG: DUF6600 domain-containing protein [Verrucomicrobiota bacterium]
MKQKPILLLIALVALFGSLYARPAKADESVSLSYFYDNLDPYGEWIKIPGHGYCWRPNGVSEGWQPYTDGYWTYTDAGWTWVSYEEFGPITYHYGRWSRLEDFGWVWSPGYEWGPAWVSWRKSNDYIGWAPLPPEADFSPSIGISISVDRDYDIGPSCYSFCEFRHFGAPVMANVVIERSRNVTIVNNTINITNITINNDRHHGRRMVFNGGLDYYDVARRSDRPIETLKLERRSDWHRGGRLSMTQKVGNQLVIEAPEVAKPVKPIAPPKVARVIEKPKFDKGWGSVSNPADRQRIEQKLQQETKGVPQHAPAKPVDIQKVQAVLPPKADPKGVPGGFRKPAAAQSAPQVNPTPAVAQPAAPTKWAQHEKAVPTPEAVRPREAASEIRPDSTPKVGTFDAESAARVKSRQPAQPRETPKLTPFGQPAEARKAKEATVGSSTGEAQPIRRQKPELQIQDQAAQEHRRNVEASKELQRAQEARRVQDLQRSQEAKRAQDAQRSQEAQAKRAQDAQGSQELRRAQEFQRQQAPERVRTPEVDRSRPRQSFEQPREPKIERSRQPESQSIQRSQPFSGSSSDRHSDDKDKKKHKDDSYQ